MSRFDNSAAVPTTPQHNPVFAAADDSPSVRPSQPGEFPHYYVNLLSLLRHRLPLEAIVQAAHRAVHCRAEAMQHFRRRIDDLYDGFAAEAERLGAPRAETLPPPCLQGWDLEPLRALQRSHGGLLLGIFHFGEHRQVLVDLACLGVPLVTPVAKHAYFDELRAMHCAPTAFIDALRLLEVENRSVGRGLLRELRGGRVGTIYVDGNMGPTGATVEDGAVNVHFFGRSIRVKSGIARLASALHLPILPLMVEPVAGTSGSAHHVRFGAPILPTGGGRGRACELRESEPQVMQQLYDALARAVIASPERWEFAFCLHRWLEPVGNDAPPTHAADERRTGWIVDGQEIATLQRDAQQYWVHVGRQRAYRIPEWASGLFDLLRTPVTDIEALERALGTDSRGKVAALLERLVGLGLVRQP